MKKFRQVFLLATLMLPSCSGDALKSNLAAFCVAGLSADDYERLYFDLEERVAFATDTKSSLAPIHSGDYVGFIYPFPVMIPSKELLLSGKQIEWEADGGSEWGADRYAFVATPEKRSEPTWFVITATQKEDPDFPEARAIQNTTVLYSIDSGVIAIRRTTEGSRFSSEDDLYLCSETKLDPLELASEGR